MMAIPVKYACTDLHTITVASKEDYIVTGTRILLVHAAAEEALDIDTKDSNCDGVSVGRAASRAAAGAKSLQGDRTPIELPS